MKYSFATLSARVREDFRGQTVIDYLLVVVSIAIAALVIYMHQGPDLSQMIAVQ